MKVLISNYTFIPSSNQVVFNDYANISLERVLLVTNVTVNTIIYNFADINNGGTVSGNVLQLGSYAVSSMSPTDKLQIYYETADSPASNEVLTQQSELIDVLYELVSRLSFLPAVRGVSADIRVSPLSTPNMSTLTTLSNIGAIGGYNATAVIKDWTNLTAINSNINNVAV